MFIFYKAYVFFFFKNYINALFLLLKAKMIEYEFEKLMSSMERELVHEYAWV